jgi:hypothetical protein
VNTTVPEAPFTGPKAAAKSSRIGGEAAAAGHAARSSRSARCRAPCLGVGDDAQREPRQRVGLHGLVEQQPIE